MWFAITIYLLGLILYAWPDSSVNLPIGTTIGSIQDRKFILQLKKQE